MFQSSISKRKEILLHILFWMAWFYFNWVDVEHEKVSVVSLDLFLITWCIVNIATFYFNYSFVLPHFFKKFKWYKIPIIWLITTLFFIILRYFLEQFLTDILFQSTNYPKSTGTIYYIYDNFLSSTRIIILSTSFWIILFIIRLLEYNHFILENQKNLEIKFLKTQINPHFVFNTLNNIYSMVYLGSPHSLNAIEKLSDIMRFLTYEMQHPTISLEKELAYIKAHIELESLRHEHQNLVTMDIQVENEQIAIPPYILSPLVENAFKHGKMEVGGIQISLYQIGSRLVFKVQNLIGAQKKDQQGGVGIENLKRRLEILYPTQQPLHIERKEQIFIAQIEIEFK